MIQFSPNLIEAVACLRLKARTVHPGQGAGEHRSPRQGSGMEFRDFRSYVPGDDLRSVDWNVYRRSGHLFLRRYDRLQTLSVYLVVDASASMFFEDPPRYERAAEVALAVASATLKHDVLKLAVVGGRDPASFRAFAGRQRLAEVGSLLVNQSAGEADVAEQVERLSQAPRPSGVTVVISDFFDDGGFSRLRNALSGLRQRLVLVPLVRKEDEEPALSGSWTLLSCESGAGRDVAIAAATRQEYRRSYRDFQESLEELAAERGGLLHPVDVRRPVLEQLGGLFPNGVLCL